MSPIPPFALVSLLLPPAVAGDPCPPPAPPPDTLGSDGTAWVVVRDDVRACLIAVDEDGESSVVTRWSLRGERAPVAMAALADGRAVLVRPDGRRWRLSVWDRRGIETPVAIWLPAEPDLLLAHPDRNLLAIRMPRPNPPAERHEARVWLVDIDARAVAALGSAALDTVPVFDTDAAVLRIGERELVAPGVALAEQPAAPYPTPLEGSEGSRRNR